MRSTQNWRSSRTSPSNPSDHSFNTERSHDHRLAPPRFRVAVSHHDCKSSLIKHQSDFSSTRTLNFLTLGLYVKATLFNPPIT